MFKWAFLICVGLFVCWHFAPKETELGLHKAWSKTTRAIAQLSK